MHNHLPYRSPTAALSVWKSLDVLVLRFAPMSRNQHALLHMVRGELLLRERQGYARLSRIEVLDWAPSEAVTDILHGCAREIVRGRVQVMV